MENGFCKRADMPAPSRSLELLSVEAIVQRCLQHDRSAWNEFFIRFTPLLNKAIRNTLIRNDATAQSQDLDIIQDIYLKVVEKLYTRNILSKCPRVEGIASWLATVASHQAIDWLKEKGRLKNLPRLRDETATCSLDAPLDEDGSTLYDVLSAEEHDDDVPPPPLGELMLSQVHGLQNEKQRWVLRLSILGQVELQEDEYQALAEITARAPEDVRKTIASLESALAKRDQERQEEHGRSVLYWHELRRYEKEYISLSLDTFTDHTAELAQLRTQIADKQALRDALVAKCRKTLRPSDREIAALVGLPENQVGITLRRARNAMTVYSDRSDVQN
jgi:DNA-directed RNA polymerase specialized sigma24 family protein